VSLTHQSQVHGPAEVGDDTFIGRQALIFKAEVGDHVVVEPDATIIGVTIASGRYVPALSIVTKQVDADDPTPIDGKTRPLRLWLSKVDGHPRGPALSCDGQKPPANRRSTSMMISFDSSRYRS
jgi:carbonic anhydrase/acetyltransferase-like protein (isoleucine patch superfamily)